MKQKKPVT